MTGFWAVFGEGLLEAAMKFAMKFYRAVRGMVVSSECDVIFVFFRHFRGRIASTARSYHEGICAKNRNYMTIEWFWLFSKVLTYFWFYYNIMQK